MFCVRTIFGVRFWHRLYLNYVRHSIWGGAFAYLLRAAFAQRLHTPTGNHQRAFAFQWPLHEYSFC